jgi:catechol 2,3-dioxygenase-like lactoylglutathione lyase family enzyme
MKVHTILYVADQKRSTEFYRSLLAVEPALNVPGMTEFQLTEGHVLGLMPEAGIRNLLGAKLPDLARGYGIPRVELYIRVADPEVFHSRALKLGAMELSPVLERDWGDRAGYVLDPDAHVIAFSS